MKKTDIKLHLRLIVAVMIMALSANAANAQTTFTSGSYTFSIDGNAATLTDVVEGATLAAETEIPSTVEYGGTTYNVTKIGNDAFYNVSSVTKITIPASVQHIGNLAFNSCTNLNEVAFASGSQLQEIGKKAFVYCEKLQTINLEVCTELTTLGEEAFSQAFRTDGYSSSIKIPQNLVEIPYGAFANCTYLSSVEFLGNITSIGNNAFYSTAISSITLPESIRSIGDYAFNYLNLAPNAAFTMTCNAINAPAIGTDIMNSSTAAYNTLNIPACGSGYSDWATYFNTINGGINITASLFDQLATTKEYDGIAITTFEEDERPQFTYIDNSNTEFSITVTDIYFYDEYGSASPNAGDNLIVKAVYDLSQTSTPAEGVDGCPSTTGNVITLTDNGSISKYKLSLDWLKQHIRECLNLNGTFVDGGYVSANENTLSFQLNFLEDLRLNYGDDGAPYGNCLHIMTGIGQDSILLRNVNAKFQYNASTSQSEVKIEYANDYVAGTVSYSYDVSEFSQEDFSNSTRSSFTIPINIYTAEVSLPANSGAYFDIQGLTESNIATLLVDPDNQISFSYQSDHTEGNYYVQVNEGTTPGTYTFKSVDEAIVVTVIVEPPVYTVTFDLNQHGTDPAPDGIDVQSGGTIDNLPTPTAAEDGFTFKGWMYKDQNDIYHDWEASSTVDADITLYAKWETIVTAAALADLISLSKTYDGEIWAMSKDNNRLYNDGADVTIAYDGVNLTFSQVAYYDADAGTGKTIAAKPNKASYTDSYNNLYTLDPYACTADVDGSITMTISSTGKITQKPLTPTIAGTIKKTYDGTPTLDITTQASLGSGAGVIAGDDVELESVTATFVDANVGVGKYLTITATLKGTDAANYIINKSAIGTIDGISATIIAGLGASINVAKLDGLTDLSLSSVKKGTETVAESGIALAADGTLYYVETNSGTPTGDYTLTVANDEGNAVAAIALTVKDYTEGLFDEDWHANPVTFAATNSTYTVTATEDFSTISKNSDGKYEISNDGIHNIRYTLNDASRNTIHSTTHTIYIDQSGPTGIELSYRDGDNNATAIPCQTSAAASAFSVDIPVGTSITITGQDLWSGIQSFFTTAEETSSLTATSGENSYEYTTTTIPTAGIYNWAVRAKDDAGNETGADEVCYVQLNVAASRTVSYTNQVDGATGSFSVLDGHMIDATQLPSTATYDTEKYNFLGWYETAAATPWDFATGTVTSDLTLTGKWQYKVTFDGNGYDLNKNGEWVDHGQTAYSAQPSKATTVSDCINLSGKWYTDSEKTTEFSILNDQITAPVTLYAGWSASKFSVSKGSNLNFTNSDEATATSNANTFKYEYGKTVKFKSPDGYRITDGPSVKATDRDDQDQTVESDINFELGDDGIYSFEVPCFNYGFASINITATTKWVCTLALTNMQSEYEYGKIGGCGVSYTGQQGATVDLTSEDLAITYKQKLTEDDNVTYQDVADINTAAPGQYVKYFHFETDDKIGDTEAEFTITKATPTITITPKTELIYNATAQYLVDVTAPDGVTVLFSTDGGETYSSTIPQGTAAQSYTIRYKTEATDNYDAIGETDLGDVTIAPYVLTLPTYAEINSDIADNYHYNVYASKPFDGNSYIKGDINGEEPTDVTGAISQSVNSEYVTLNYVCHYADADGNEVSVPGTGYNMLVEYSLTGTNASNYALDDDFSTTATMLYTDFAGAITTQELPLTAGLNAKIKITGLPTDLTFTSDNTGAAIAYDATDNCYYLTTAATATEGDYTLATENNEISATVTVKDFSDGILDDLWHQSVSIPSINSTYSVTVSQDGTSLVADGNGKYNITTEGEITYTVKTELGDIIQSTTHTVRIDNTAPAITVADPDGNEVTCAETFADATEITVATGSAIALAAADEQSGIFTLSYSTGANDGSTVSSTSLTAAVPATAGQYTWTITATDNATNEKNCYIQVTAKAVHTVSFSTSVGENPAQQSVLDGEKATEPADFASGDSHFKGWYNGNDLWDFDAAVTADLTLTARWEYTVTLPTHVKFSDYDVTPDADGRRRHTFYEGQTVNYTAEDGYVTVNSLDNYRAYKADDHNTQVPSQGWECLTMPAYDVEVTATFRKSITITATLANFTYGDKEEPVITRTDNNATIPATGDNVTYAMQVSGNSYYGSVEPITSSIWSSSAGTYNILVMFKTDDQFDESGALIADGEYGECKIEGVTISPLPVTLTISGITKTYDGTTALAQSADDLTYTVKDDNGNVIELDQDNTEIILDENSVYSNAAVNDYEIPLTFKSYMPYGAGDNYTFSNCESLGQSYGNYSYSTKATGVITPIQLTAAGFSTAFTALVNTSKQQDGTTAVDFIDAATNTATLSGNGILETETVEAEITGCTYDAATSGSRTITFEVKSNNPNYTFGDNNTFTAEGEIWDEYTIELKETAIAIYKSGNTGKVTKGQLAYQIKKNGELVTKNAPTVTVATSDGINCGSAIENVNLNTYSDPVYYTVHVVESPQGKDGTITLSLGDGYHCTNCGTDATKASVTFQTVTVSATIDNADFDAEKYYAPGTPLIVTIPNNYPNTDIAFDNIKDSERTNGTYTFEPADQTKDYAEIDIRVNSCNSEGLNDDVVRFAYYKVNYKTTPAITASFANDTWQYHKYSATDNALAVTDGDGNAITSGLTYAYAVNMESVSEAYITLNDVSSIQTFNPGSYKLKIVLPATESTNEASTTVPFTIEKAVATLAVEMSETFTYGSTDIGPTSIKKDGTALAADDYTLTYQNADGETITDPVTAPVGTYTLTVSYDTDTETAKLTKTFQITKATFEVVVGPNTGLSYRGEYNTLFFYRASSLLTTLQFRLGDDGEWISSSNVASNTALQAKDAGTYTIYYKADATDNYDAIPIQSITATIDKWTLTPTIPSASIATKAYDGTTTITDATALSSLGFTLNDLTILENSNSALVKVTSVTFPFAAAADYTDVEYALALDESNPDVILNNYQLTSPVTSSGSITQCTIVPNVTSINLISYAQGVDCIITKGLLKAAIKINGVEVSDISPTYTVSGSDITYDQSTGVVSASSANTTGTITISLPEQYNADPVTIPVTVANEFYVEAQIGDDYYDQYTEQPWHNDESLTVTLTFSGDYNGVLYGPVETAAAETVEYTYTSSNSSDGEHYMKVFAKSYNDSGEEEDLVFETFPVRIDRTSPTAPTTFSYNYYDEEGNSQTATISGYATEDEAQAADQITLYDYDMVTFSGATDATSGIKQIVYGSASDLASDYPFENTAMAEEETGLSSLSGICYFRSEDNAGNKSTVKYLNLNVMQSYGPTSYVEITSMEPSSWTYGETPTITYTVTNNFEALDESEYYLSYQTSDFMPLEDMPTAAGDYQVIATLYSDGSVSNTGYPFTIQKADPPAPVIIENLTFDGTDQTLVTATDLNDGDGHYEFSTNGVDYSSTIPTGNAAGDYTIYWQYTGGNNYNAYTPETTLTAAITPAAITVNITAPTTTYGYPVSAADIIHDGATDLDLDITFDCEVLTSTAAPAAGEYAITPNSGNTNYNVTFNPPTPVWTIEKATPNVVISSYLTYYCGQSWVSDLVTAYPPNGDSNIGISWTIKNPNGEEAPTHPTMSGTYEVTVVPTDDNYNTVTKTFDVTYKTFSIGSVTIDHDSYVYNGFAIKPSVTVYGTDGNTIEQTTTEYVDDNRVEVENYKITYTDNTNAGTAKATIEGQGCYVGSSETVDFNINKADVIFSVQDHSYTYIPDGVWSAPETFSAQYATQYSTDFITGGTWTLLDETETAITAPTKTGTYKAKFTPSAADAANIKEAVSDAFTITFIKADRTDAPAVTATAETICGKSDGYIAGLTTEMEYRPSTEDTWYSISTAGLTDLPADQKALVLAPGTYDVRYAATDNTNASAATTVTIAEGAHLTVKFFSDGAEIAALAQSNICYNGSPTEPTGEAVPEKTGNTFDGWYTDTEFQTQWNFATGKVTSDLDLYAKWDVNSYTLTYKVDGEVYGEVETIEFGKELTQRAAPTKTGYTFSGWQNVPETMPARDVEVTGSFTVNKYAVTLPSGMDFVTANNNNGKFDYGTQVQFNTKDGYESSDVKMSYSINNVNTETPLTAANGIYTIASMPAADVEISATVKEKVKLTVADMDYICGSGAWSAPDGFFAYRSDNSGTHLPGSWTLMLADGSTEVSTVTSTGSYKAQFTPTGNQNYTWAISDEFKITFKRTITASFANSTWTYLGYNDTDNALTITDCNDNTITENLKYSYRVKDSESSDYISVDGFDNVKTFNAGNYTLKVDLLDDKNAIEASATADFTIKKADLVITDAQKPTANKPNGKNLVYNGDEQELVVAPKETSDLYTIMYKLSDEEEYNYEIPTATDAGDYTVNVKYVGDGNHESFNGDDIATTIDKADITNVTAPQAIDNLVYDGNDQALITAGSAPNGTMMYSVDNNDYQTAIPTGNAAGPYTVRYMVKGNINYNDYTPDDDATITVKIKGVYTIRFYDYDGTTLLGETSAVEGETPVYPGTSAPERASDKTYSYTFSGWSPALAPATGSQDYKAQYTSTVNCFSASAEQEKLVYTGEERKPTLKVFTKPADTEFALVGDGESPEYEVVWPQDVINADSKTATVKGLGVFSGCQSQAITWTITRAKYDKPSDAVVTGVSETIQNKADGKITGVSDAMEYRKSGVDAYTSVAASASEISPLAPGDYYVRYKEDGNHLASDDLNVTVGASNTQLTVSFDSEGTTVSSVASPFGVTISKPSPDPSKKGHAFGGWYTNSDCTTEWNFASDKVEDNITLYAKWNVKQYSVTFVFGNGKPDLVIKADFGTDISNQLPENPEWLGHNFTGWDSEIPTTIPADNVTITAQWEDESKQYVKFVTKWDDNTVTTYKSIEAYPGETISVTAPEKDPERTGYKFDGWSETTFPAVMPDDGLTIYAQWVINQYTITFNTVGGTAINPITQDYNTAITNKPENPTKEGHTFGGWDKTIPDYMPAENITITAKWTTQKYTVTFNSNGGTPVADVKQEYNQTITAPDAPTKEGNTFKGWFTDDVTFAAPWTFGTDKVTKDITLYAKWDVNKYTLSFDTDGGSLVSDIEQNFGTDVTAPNAPTKEGHTFGYWMVDNVETNIPATMPAKDITFKAHWNVNTYKIIFHLDNGDPDVVVEAKYGASIAAPANFFKENHTFDRWSRAIPTTMPASDAPIEITALWIEDGKYTVTLLTENDNHEEEVVWSSRSFFEGDDVDYTGYEDPTRDGYDFQGWTTTADGQPASLPTKMPEGGVKLYAKWTIKQYTITYNTNGGSDISELTRDYNSAIPKPGDPSKTGNTFKGWYTDENCETPCDFVSSKVTADITLYAKWEVNTYTITFDTDGGSAIESITQDYDTDITAPNNPTKEGFEFTGWDPEIPAKMPVDGITVKAKWIENVAPIIQSITINGSRVYSYNPDNTDDAIVVETSFDCLGSALVEIEATDNTSAPKVVYTLNGVNNVYAAPFTIDTPGSYEISVTATDNAGNTCEPVVAKVVVHKEATLATTAYTYTQLSGSDLVLQGLELDGAEVYSITIDGVESTEMFKPETNALDNLRLDNVKVGTHTLHLYTKFNGEKHDTGIEATLTVNGFIVEAEQRDIYEDGYCEGEMSVSTLEFLNMDCPKYYKIDGIHTEYQAFENWGSLGEKLGQLKFAVTDKMNNGNISFNVTFSNDPNTNTESEVKTFSVKINASSEYIIKLFDDIVAIDNHDDLFTAFQWYRDGEPIPGADQQYYQTADGKPLTGKYNAYVTKATGEKVKICSVDLGSASLAKSAKRTVNAYPNPARAGEEVTIELLNYNDEDYQGCTIKIVNNAGSVVQTISNCDRINTVSLPVGTYTGYVLRDGKSDRVSFKLIVK